MDDFKKFINQYKGAIIGIIIAIVLLATRLYDVIIGILLILAGAIIGNYVQQNKDDVKAKLKKLLDDGVISQEEFDEAKKKLLGV